MTRDSEAILLEFCARQQRGFQEHAWTPPAGVKDDELAAVALYLAGVNWYGHREHLLRVANRLHAGCTFKFSDLVRATDFDAPRFAGLLKARLEHARAS